MPFRPARTDCRIVVTPQIATVANTARDRYASLTPAARITIVGTNMMAAMVSTAI